MRNGGAGLHECHTHDEGYKLHILEIFSFQSVIQQIVFVLGEHAEANICNLTVDDIAAIVNIRLYAVSQRIHCSGMDALAHGVESYLHNNNNAMNKMFGEFGFKLFASFKDGLLSGDLTDEDFENITLHSYVQGMAFSSTGSSTTIPHGMGYPISHVKHVNHGLSCAIFLAEYVRGFKDQSLVQPIVEMCGFKNSDEFAEYCKTLINRHVDIEVSNEEMETGRTKSNPEPLEREDIVNLYRLSLAPYLK